MFLYKANLWSKLRNEFLQREMEEAEQTLKQ